MGRETLVTLPIDWPDGRYVAENLPRARAAGLSVEIQGKNVVLTDPLAYPAPVGRSAIRADNWRRAQLAEKLADFAAPCWAALVDAAKDLS